MHTLYCMPLGETKRREFVARYLNDLRQGRGNATALVLPNSFLLEQARRQIRESGIGGHGEVQLLAFDELAEKIVLAAGNKPTVINRVTQELLVAQILDDLSAAGEIPYFGQIAHFPGYIGNVTSLLGEIRRAGVTPEEFAGIAEARDQNPKDSEIAKIYAAYRERLEQLGLADLEEIYFQALAVLDGPVDLSYTQIYFSEFYDFTPLQLAIIGKIKTKAALTVGLVYEKGRDDLFAPVWITCGRLQGMGFKAVFEKAGAVGVSPALKHIRQGLFAPEAEPAQDSGGVKLIFCPNRTKEIAVVGAQVKSLLLSGQYKPADIALAVRDADKYGQLRDRFEELGVPLSFPRQKLLGETPLARLVINILEGRIQGGSRPVVTNLIKAPYVRFLFKEFQPELIEKEMLPYVLTDWQDWLTGLRTVRVAHASEGVKVLAFLHAQVASLPERGTAADFTAAFKTIIDNFKIPELLGEGYRGKRLTADILRRELMAYRKINEILEATGRDFALIKQAGRQMSLKEFKEHLARLLSSEVLTLSQRIDDAVQVISPEAVRGVTFPVVYILGLSDGEFPRRARENWLYSDAERALMVDLGLELDTRRLERQREDLFFAGAAALARDRLTLSIVEDAETLPSCYVDEVRRLFTGVVTERYDVNQILPDAYQDVFSPRELKQKALLDRFSGRGEPDAGESSIIDGVLAEMFSPDYWRKVEAEKERVAGQGGRVGGAEWDKYVIEKFSDNPVFGVSALKAYAFCPFRFFAGNVLMLKTWEEGREDTEDNVLGEIYHEVMAGFYRRRLNQRLKAEDARVYEEELRCLLDEVCLKFERQGKIRRERTWQYEERQIWRLLLNWLKFEIASHSEDGLVLTPAYLEWGFGLPVDEGMDPASVAEPLWLEADDLRIGVRGKIDRVDKCGDKVAVIDYKKASYPDSREITELGTDLQIPLYIMAVQQHLFPAPHEIVGGGYYSIQKGEKNGGIWREEFKAGLAHRKSKKVGNLAAGDWRQVLDNIKARALDCARGIKAGRFPVQPAAKCPKFCPAARVCRFDRFKAGINDSEGED